MRGRFSPAIFLAALVLLLGLAPPTVRADTPGDFAFYVLSLSWSPTYCETSQGRSDRIQCGGRPFAFVVHGLWPQHERGYPSDCPSAGPMGVSGAIIDGMLDIMPSPGLIRHEWRTHGTCSGLPQRAYFDLIRRASEIVRIPERFTDLQDAATVSPREVEAAFHSANPGLPADGIGIACDSRRLKEVRVCLTRDLSFRSCPEVDRASCRRDRLVMPPVR